ATAVGWPQGSGVHPMVLVPPAGPRPTPCAGQPVGDEHREGSSVRGGRSPDRAAVLGHTARRPPLIGGRQNLPGSSPPPTIHPAAGHRQLPHIPPTAGSSERPAARAGALP